MCAKIRFACLNAFVKILQSENFPWYLFYCVCRRASLFVYCLIISLIRHQKIVERSICILMGYTDGL